jgi:histidine triad (HIT) family protein
MRTAQKVAAAAMKAFGAAGITLQQFNGRAGGQVVFHLHFHILPRFEGVALAPPASKMEKPEVLAANAEMIRKVLVS